MYIVPRAEEESGSCLVCRTEISDQFKSIQVGGLWRMLAAVYCDIVFPPFRVDPALTVSLPL